MTDDDEFSSMWTTVSMDNEPITIESMERARAEVLSHRVPPQPDLLRVGAITNLVPSRNSGKSQHQRDQEMRFRMLSYPGEISPWYGLGAIMDIPSPRFTRLRRSLFKRTIGRTNAKRHHKKSAYPRATVHRI
jgi:hypothetical protein